MTNLNEWIVKRTNRVEDEKILRDSTGRFGAKRSRNFDKRFSGLRSTTDGEECSSLYVASFGNDILKEKKRTIDEEERKNEFSH